MAIPSSRREHEKVLDSGGRGGARARSDWTPAVTVKRQIVPGGHSPDWDANVLRVVSSINSGQVADPNRFARFPDPRVLLAVVQHPAVTRETLTAIANYTGDAPGTVQLRGVAQAKLDED